MANNDMRRVLAHFSELVTARLARWRTATEDSVRYSFFHSLVTVGEVDPVDIQLETAHPAILGAEVDLLVPARAHRPGMVFEFKYDRRAEGASNSPRTQKAGKVLADLARLAMYHPLADWERYLIYLTDREMLGYWRNEANGLNRLFDLAVGETMNLDANFVGERASSISKAVEGRVLNCAVQLAFSADAGDPSGVWTRAFFVRPA